MTTTLLTVFVLMMCAMPVGAQTAARYAGRPLADALRDLQSRGLKVVFSSELVRPEMRVPSEPKSTAPRTILDEVLAPNGLRAAAGPKDTWLVVRAPKAPVAQAPALVTVNGQIVAGANKTPVAGAIIEAIATSGPGATRRAVADASGRFAIDAALGALRLEIIAAGFVTQRVDLMVAAGMPAIEIVLV